MITFGEVGSISPPEALLDLMEECSKKPFDLISVTRETLDRNPIGWVVTMTLFTGEGKKSQCMIFSDDTGDDLRGYLDGQHVGLDVVVAWLNTIERWSYEETMSALFSSAMRNGWNITLGRSVFGISHTVPDVLHLDATAPDYQHQGRPRTQVRVSRFAGSADFSQGCVTEGNVTVSDIDKACEMLGKEAPMTVPTLVYEESDD